MKIKLIVVGKTKERYLQTGEQEFITRIKRYIDLELVVVKEEKLINKSDELKIKRIEGERILRRIGQYDWTVALDRKGRQFSSEQFAEFFMEKNAAGVKYITFIIGRFCLDQLFPIIAKEGQEQDRKGTHKSISKLCRKCLN